MIKGRPKLEWTPEMAMRFWDFEQNFPERYFTYRHGAELVDRIDPPAGGHCERLRRV